MMLDDYSDKEPYPLNAALMSATPEVLLRKGAADRDNLAKCTLDDTTCEIVGKSYAAVSSHFALQTYSGPQRGKDAPWAVNEAWICLQDRLFGLMEFLPDKVGQKASGVSSHWLFGTGGGPPAQMRPGADGHHFTYGKLFITVQDTNFPNLVDTPSTTIRGQKVDELILSDTDPKVTTDPTYSPDKPYYAIVEVGASNTPEAKVTHLTLNGGLTGFQVSLNAKVFTVIQNTSRQPASTDLLTYAPPAVTSSLHFPHDSARPIVSPVPATFSLDPLSQILVVSSPDAADHQAGWENYPAMAAAVSP
jgi:hypothetical protein